MGRRRRCDARLIEAFGLYTTSAPSRWGSRSIGALTDGRAPPGRQNVGRGALIARWSARSTWFVGSHEVYLLLVRRSDFQRLRSTCTPFFVTMVSVLFNGEAPLSGAALAGASHLNNNISQQREWSTCISELLPTCYQWYELHPFAPTLHADVCMWQPSGLCRFL